MSQINAERYSRALIELAAEEKKIAKSLEDLKGFLGLLKQSELLEKVLHQKVFQRFEKQKVLEKILDQMPFLETTKNFIIHLAKKNRLHLLPQIMDCLEKEIALRNDVERAIVTSAQELSLEERGKIGKKLETVIGKNLEIRYETDPSVLGGFVAKMGNNLFDGSLKSQLSLLQKCLESGK